MHYFTHFFLHQILNGTLLLWPCKRKTRFQAVKSQFDLTSNAIISDKLPRILAFSRLKLRRSRVAKFALLVLAMTYCALKMIIVSDIQEWDENTPRDVSRYILPGLSISPAHFYGKKLDRFFSSIEKTLHAYLPRLVICSRCVLQILDRKF